MEQYIAGPGKRGALYYIEKLDTYFNKISTFLFFFFPPAATMYLNGEGGLPPNATRALELYERGVRAGDADAALNLGLLYAHGHGDAVPRNVTRALEHMEASPRPRGMTRNQHILISENRPACCTAE